MINLQKLFPENWKAYLALENLQSTFNTIEKSLNNKQGIVFPPTEKIFAAFDNCKPENVKVIIVGQDPYHGINQANGLAFSVNKTEKIPPSLRNIFKELQNEKLSEEKANGDLTSWSEQGVLLLNQVLTVEQSLANSHGNIGWQKFSHEVIKKLGHDKQARVFMLWGNHAQKVENLLNLGNNLILKSGHPSPMSANQGKWFGNNHFLRCNEFLKKNGLTGIDW